MIPHITDTMFAFEDPFKYVEDRFNNAGGDFRKFFSDVVGDFFPQSADPANPIDDPVALKEGNSAVNSTGNCSSSETVSDCAEKQSSVAIERADQAEEVQSTISAGDECRNAETLKCQEVQDSDETEQVVIDTDHENQRVASDSESKGVLCDVTTGSTRSSFDPVGCGVESPVMRVFAVASSWESLNDEFFEQEALLNDELEEASLEFTFTESPDELLSPNPALSTSLETEIEESPLAFTTTGFVTGAPEERPSPIPDLATPIEYEVEETQPAFSTTGNVTVAPEELLSLIPASATPMDDQIEETPLTSSTECVTESPNEPLSPIPVLVTPMNDEVEETILASSFSQLSMESFDDSVVDVVDESDMETVDLHDEVSLGESCVFVDDTVLYSASRRAQKRASYKKKIQDLFSSKKRVAKEYEQLAIWYGDTDLDSKPETSNSQARKLCDLEWELL